MAVGAIDGEDVDFIPCHFLGALEEIARGAEGGADAEAAFVVFCCAWVFKFFSGCP